ncbi:MAG: hypothetical protein AAGK04_05390 [Planctomycetota bacterium]
MTDHTTANEVDNASLGDGKKEELGPPAVCVACRKEMVYEEDVESTCPHCGEVWNREAVKQFSIEALKVHVAIVLAWCSLAALGIMALLLWGLFELVRVHPRYEWWVTTSLLFMPWSFGLRCSIVSMSWGWRREPKYPRMWSKRSRGFLLCLAFAAIAGLAVSNFFAMLQAARP